MNLDKQINQTDIVHKKQISEFELQIHKLNFEKEQQNQQLQELKLQNNQQQLNLQNQQRIINEMQQEILSVQKENYQYRA